MNIMLWCMTITVLNMKVLYNSHYYSEVVAHLMKIHVYCSKLCVAVCVLYRVVRGLYIVVCCYVWYVNNYCNCIDNSDIAVRMWINCKLLSTIIWKLYTIVDK